MTCGILVTTLSFAPQLDTSFPVAGRDDGSLRVFDLGTKNPSHAKILQPHVARVTSVALSDLPDSGISIVSMALDHVLAITAVPQTDE